MGLIASRARNTATAERNVDDRVVEGFGEEWTRFDQSVLAPGELAEMASAYFAIFPFAELPADAVGMDVGCGSGRWARVVAPRVGRLCCVDASDSALAVAEKNLAEFSNVTFHHATASALPFGDETMDFGYCLGVLHHVPNTEAALRHCVAKLRPNAPFLLYLYYAFDNRPHWFRALWRASEGVRYVVSRSPFGVRYGLSQVLAAVVYWPLSRLARLVEHAGGSVEHFPLSVYRNRSFYVLRTDALDRFGTRLEQRFTRTAIEDMMVRAGLRDVRFSQSAPYWCAVGYKAA
jgi:SAM-dependent methyltransferase